MELKENTVVAERFRLVRMLGEGGMGSVWLARHERLDTLCAVKFIHADFASAASVRDRFEREAKIAAQLKSPNVVGVLDYGVWSGIQYLAMEYLEGEDLAHRLDTRGRLSGAETCSIIAQVSRALTKAHAAGLVHRDLKPENVFLARDEDGETAKVLDFGIAKAQTPLTGGQTQTGAILGTPRFMSPEQAEGKRTVDHRSDLWALGVIAYRCIVGALPFDSDALGNLLMRIMVHPLPVPSQVAPGLPAAFDAWWAKAASRDPEQRFQSARELSESLALALGTTGGAVHVPPPSGDPVSAMAMTSPQLTPPFQMTPAPVTPQPYVTPATQFGAPPPVSAHTPPPTVPIAPTPMPIAAPNAAVSVNTMNPASRTFAGQPKKSAAPWIVLAVVIAAGATAGLMLFLQHPAGDAQAVASAQSTTAPAVSASAAPSAAAPPIVVPSSGDAASAAPLATSAAPVQRPTLPKPVSLPIPPPPARTGKVHLTAP